MTSQEIRSTESLTWRTIREVAPMGGIVTVSGGDRVKVGEAAAGILHDYERALASLVAAEAEIARLRSALPGTVAYPSAPAGSGYLVGRENK